MRVKTRSSDDRAMLTTIYDPENRTVGLVLNEPDTMVS